MGGNKKPAAVSALRAVWLWWWLDISGFQADNNRNRGHKGEELEGERESIQGKLREQEAVMQEALLSQCARYSVD